MKGRRLLIWSRICRSCGREIWPTLAGEGTQSWPAHCPGCRIPRWDREPMKRGRKPKKPS